MKLPVSGLSFSSLRLFHSQSGFMDAKQIPKTVVHLGDKVTHDMAMPDNGASMSTHKAASLPGN